MRIIAGEFKGRELVVASDRQGYRPTLARVRESLFSSLVAIGSNNAHLFTGFENQVVLDLYAGSGSLGFEALSRGAARAVFVDSSRQAVAKIGKTAANFGISERVSTVGKRVEKHLKHALGAEFGLVFADPPYGDISSVEILGMLASGKWVSRASLIVLESDSRDQTWESGAEVELEEGEFNCISFKKYGQTSMGIFSLR